MSVPITWVERIWATMRATYGAAFDRQWECPSGVDPATHVADMKAHWARELGVYVNAPEALGYALENLPDRPPNLIEFRRICNGRPVYAPTALPAPAPDPKRALEALEAFAAKKSAPRVKSLAQQCINNIERLCNGKPSSAQKHVVAHCLRMPGTSTTLPVISAGSIPGEVQS